MSTHDAADPTKNFVASTPDHEVELLSPAAGDDIHVFAIPAHTSHWLQPLDVGVFRSFKHGWQKAMKEFTRDSADRKLEKRISSLYSIKHGTMELQQRTAELQGGFCGTARQNLPTLGQCYIIVGMAGRRSSTLGRHWANIYYRRTVTLPVHLKPYVQPTFNV